MESGCGGTKIPPCFLNCVESKWAALLLKNAGRTSDPTIDEGDIRGLFGI